MARLFWLLVASFCSLVGQSAHAQITERISLATGGSQAASGDNAAPSVSADGRYIAFWSSASNLVPGDINGRDDVFVRDRQTGSTELVSVGLPGGNAGTFGHSYDPVISADGNIVAFVSQNSFLVTGDTNNRPDIFVRDRQAGATTRVSVATGDVQSTGGTAFGTGTPSVSADGRYVAFTSDATDLVANDTNAAHDVFVHDRQTGITTRVSVAAGGAQATGTSAGTWHTISSDGRYVVFRSNAANVVQNDTNGLVDAFVHDRQESITTRVSLSTAGLQADAHIEEVAISDDGRFVAFHTRASTLVAGDANEVDDVFVHDRQTGVTTRESVDANGGSANGFSSRAVISGDGRFVAFGSIATNLVAGDSNNLGDTFVRDRETGLTARVSVATGGVQGTGGHSSGAAISISADGTIVAFPSHKTNLVADDTNGIRDVFARDIAARIDVSVSPPGSGSAGGEGEFLVGTDRTVTATANAGYTFVDWAENGASLSTSANYTFTLADDLTLVANFEAVDTDSDGLPDLSDNCPNTSNSDQADNYGTAAGDACEDTDGDVVNDDVDNCPLTANAGQADIDNDNVGDACDSVDNRDTDGDGIINSNDNCPATSNSDQANNYGTGAGDVCEDTDGDVQTDAFDNCPLVANADQADTDGDGLGDACDPDGDNEGINERSDNCPLVSNPGQANTDGNSQGDACDPDDDNDGDDGQLPG